ncbi:OLC1v1015656C1 [Oldenlandia corymbosa var. corymbosa]|uniref:OLC1v1015656C1 n=1 Tax=Oldenlandia corymbosa var. corymbosa TaxID=529605 RepID=A0AAV1E628_OLDCO|nr:OLC1v1015656C1 [Oldenlandia corymbosa var. corymbosa]
MVSNPLLLVVLFILLNSCSSSSSSSAYNFPIAKPGCLDRCGNESIPFPFGIGEGCYLDQSQSFSVECNSSQLNFSGTHYPITNISLEGQFRTPNYVAYDCYGEGDQKVNPNHPWIKLGDPFIFNSTGNKFTVIGCDSIGVVEGTSYFRDYNTKSGCTSFCYLKEDVEDGSCSSIGCCQTSIPGGSRMINVTLASSSNNRFVSSFNPCSFAFVVAEDAFQFSADNLTNLESVVTLPVIVDWVISHNNCDEAKTNKSNYACKENSECYVEKGALGYRCRCSKGYEGNPYLGCQDIDECGNPDQCGKNGVCINTTGSYYCNCKKGYHQDAEGRCVEKNNNWAIIVG